MRTHTHKRKQFGKQVIYRNQIEIVLNETEKETGKKKNRQVLWDIGDWMMTFQF